MISFRRGAGLGAGGRAGMGLVAVAPAIEQKEVAGYLPTFQASICLCISWMLQPRLRALPHTP